MSEFENMLKDIQTMQTLVKLLLGAVWFGSTLLAKAVIFQYYMSLRLNQCDLISQTWKIQTFALGELDRHDKPLHLQRLIRALMCSSTILNICNDNRRVRSDCALAHARPGICFLHYAKLWISHPESKDNNLPDTFWTIHSKDIVQNVYYTWKEVTNKSFLANLQVGHYFPAGDN